LFNHTFPTNSPQFIHHTHAHTVALACGSRRARRATPSTLRPHTFQHPHGPAGPTRRALRAKGGDAAARHALVAAVVVAGELDEPRLKSNRTFGIDTPRRRGKGRGGSPTATTLLPQRGCLVLLPRRETRAPAGTARPRDCWFFSLSLGGNKQQHCYVSTPPSRRALQVAPQPRHLSSPAGAEGEGWDHPGGGAHLREHPTA
jgi:hypothetical protein